MTLAPAAQKRHARFTVEQFHRLCEAVPEQRLELIDGEVLQVIAKGTRHTAVVHRLIQLVQQQLQIHPQALLQLRVEAPLDLGPGNEPEPDLALVAQRDDDYWSAHPTAAETVLVIEVADISLAFDLQAKAQLYADAGIANYWVIDVLQPDLHLVHQRRDVADASDALLASLLQGVVNLLSALPR